MRSIKPFNSFWLHMTSNEYHQMFVSVWWSQIHAHYDLKKSSRHKRNLAITGGVALSIITAPVVAAVSVGKKT